MKIGVIIFPGSNCDEDCVDAVRFGMKETVVKLWHNQDDLQNVDAILVPGGFSYGDYLRTGAIARFSPVMQAVAEFAEKGGPVLGICNGFQILTEAGLLPGALTKNTSLRFQCEQVLLAVENTKTPFTQLFLQDEVIQLPIAHGEGNYVIDPEDLKRLEDNHQVVFRYEHDVNGSMNRIAGVCNEKGNVVGLMPHPERNLFDWNDESHSGSPLWNGSGARFFESLKHSLLAVV
jgi:phosphoribosylformylglycinamidine synthase I